MAGTVIDELIVTLGLDPSNYTKGQKDAAKSLLKTRQEAEKTAKEMERRGKEAAAFFTKIRNEALATFAVFAIGGGITGFVERSIKSLSDLGYASENLGMSAKRLDGWEKAAQRAGGTAAGMAAQLKQSADAVANFHMGMSSPDVDWFFRMGGDASALKNGNTYLLARAKILHDLYLKNPTEAVMLAGKMGISDSEWNFIKQGPGAIRAQVAAQERLSNATRQNVMAARKLNQEYLDIKNRMQSVSEQLVIEMFPLFKDFCDWLLKAADWLVKNKTEINAWADEAVADAREFAHAANDVAQAVGGWKTVLEALLLLKVATFARDMLSLAGAVGKVGSALNATLAAGTVGWMIGTYIRNHLSADTQDKIGGLVAETLDAFGVKSAHNAVVTHKEGQRADYMMRQLILGGYTREQAAGIVGSTMQESRLDPTAVNKQSGAGGIAQWLDKGRRAEYMRMFHTTPEMDSFENQVAFMIYELNHSQKAAGDAIRHAKTAAQAAALHMQLYERPGAHEGNLAQRVANARSVLSWNQPIHYIDTARWGTMPANHYNWQTTHNTSSAETHIGKVEIHTNATDAEGIARDASNAFSKYNSFAAQANTGLVG